jgi:hypothetical protein
MQQQLLNYEEARNDEYISSFVNSLQNELPAVYHFYISNGNNDERPAIYMHLAHGNRVTAAKPIFQIDSNYNLYNIDTRGSFDVSDNITQSNGANIRTMITNPQSNAAMNGWNSVMDHVNHERQVEHLDEALHSMMNNNNIQHNLGDRLVNGKKLT